MRREPIGTTPNTFAVSHPPHAHHSHKPSALTAPSAKRRRASSADPQVVNDTELDRFVEDRQGATGLLWAARGLMMGAKIAKLGNLGTKSAGTDAKLGHETAEAVKLGHATDALTVAGGVLGLIFDAVGAWQVKLGWKRARHERHEGKAATVELTAQMKQLEAREATLTDALRRSNPPPARRRALTQWLHENTIAQQDVRFRLAQAQLKTKDGTARTEGAASAIFQSVTANGLIVAGGSVALAVGGAVASYLSGAGFLVAAYLAARHARHMWHERHTCHSQRKRAVHVAQTTAVDTPLRRIADIEAQRLKYQQRMFEVRAGCEGAIAVGSAVAAVGHLITPFTGIGGAVVTAVGYALLGLGGIGLGVRWLVHKFLKRRKSAKARRLAEAQTLRTAKEDLRLQVAAEVRAGRGAYMDPRSVTRAEARYFGVEVGVVVRDLETLLTMLGPAPKSHA